MNNELLAFATQYKKMRLAQSRYFELSVRASKTKHPDDFKTKKDALVIAKQLEKDLDQKADQILAEEIKAPN